MTMTTKHQEMTIPCQMSSRNCHDQNTSLEMTMTITNETSPRKDNDQQNVFNKWPWPAKHLEEMTMTRKHHEMRMACHMSSRNDHFQDTSSRNNLYQKNIFKEWVWPWPEYIFRNDHVHNKQWNISKKWPAPWTTKSLELKLKQVQMKIQLSRLPWIWTFRDTLDGRFWWSCMPHCMQEERNKNW